MTHGNHNFLFWVLLCCAVVLAGNTAVAEIYWIAGGEFVSVRGNEVSIFRGRVGLEVLAREADRESVRLVVDAVEPVDGWWIQVEGAGFSLGGPFSGLGLLVGQQVGWVVPGAEVSVSGSPNFTGWSVVDIGSGLVVEGGFVGELGWMVRNVGWFAVGLLGVCVAVAMGAWVFRRVSSYED